MESQSAKNTFVLFVSEKKLQAKKLGYEIGLTALFQTNTTPANEIPKCEKHFCAFCFRKKLQAKKLGFFRKQKSQCQRHRDSA